MTGAVCRERLFTLLDSRKGQPVTWLAAPGGAGKSTLVASYLDARALPCIWYHCDAGDADLATFFYYMGLATRKAAPRFKIPLPLLTPEYLADIPTFTRRYFETLYQRVKTIVLDNYQDIPAESPFHGMIATALDAIPDEVRVIIISRSPPPVNLSRLQAHDRIKLLEYGDLRFTMEESAELIHNRIPGLDLQHIQVMHNKVEGWAAGIILMTERGNFDFTTTASSSERIFDYFAGEVFNRKDAAVKDFLLKTAFLPVLSPSEATLLTGVDNAGRILSTFNRHHLFTERLSGNTLIYQYHPLFRTFLVNRAKRTFASDELGDIQRKSALLLEQSGQTEDAARLYCEIGDRVGLSRIIIQHARELIRQGRSKTLEEWIACIPGESAENDPWVSYWAGICAFPMDLTRTRTCLEKAFASFKENNNSSGLYLTWAGIVDSYAFGEGWKNLDDCIAVFDELSKTFPSFPSQEIELTVSSRMLIALTLRKTDQPHRVNEWLERVSELLLHNPSFEIQMDTVFGMSIYYLWKGEYDKNAVLLERAESEIRHHRPSPFAVIRIKLMKGIHLWISAEYQAALKILGEALDISAQSGVHLYDSLLWSFRAAAEMASGNLEHAEKSLANQMSSLLGMKNALNTFFYHANAAWYAMLTNDPNRAIEHMEIISTSTESMGTPYYQALWDIGMAQAVFMRGQTAEAKKLIQSAHRISLSMKSHVLEWYAQLVEAYFSLQEGKEEEGFKLLRHGLSLGKRYGYVHLEFYQPDVMRYLFTKALAEGIEQAYVIGLIKELGFTPSIGGHSASSVCYPEAWPYPLKIRTLGTFEILINDEALVFSSKEQKKPLELLKALIACGGQNVPRERLTDALWPDSDGDLALKSFEMTLSRLRRLLGKDDVILSRARHLSIDARLCWVDSLALEQLMNRIQDTPDEQVMPLCAKAIKLYRGPFLAADAGLHSVVVKRETLKNRLLRVIMRAGRQHEQAADWEAAARQYEVGIETDSLAEEFHRNLMICQRNLGNHAAAVKTYNRCCSLLRAELGIEPSPATTAVYSSIASTL